VGETLVTDTHTATIMVTDLVGSTPLRVRLGEEDADLLRRTHDNLVRTAVERHSGTVVKGLGDGVLAMFEGAADAVSAAVSIQQSAYAHNHEAPDQSLDVRIGLSAGDVSVEAGDCFGTPVVEASRLCASAAGGQILAADIVRALARGRGGHVFRASGERELKGLPDPVPVSVVGWDPPELVHTVVPFPPRLAPQAPLPFSGRGPQFELLVDAWKHAASGERRMVLVSGEPGIGKTRLASEVARHAHDMGAVVLFGRCDEDMGVPFQPFVDALEFAVQSGVSAERLGRHAGELVRLVPDIAQRTSGLNPPLSADPETERYRLFDAVAAWLGALSEPGGVLLVLDDLHWAEKPTLLLLRHLIRSAEPMRLFVIGTYRDTDLDRARPLANLLADFHREGGVERLDLSGLDVEGINELLLKAADERTDMRAAQLAQMLWNETEGNPFFIQEIIRSLVESGRLVQRDGVWTTDVELIDLGIPQGVREVVGRRLTRLSESANNVLAFASVIGPTVDVDLLVAVCGLDVETVLDALDEATAAALLRETGSGAYEFTHALVRSTLYDELSATRRARRHTRVAEALEARPQKDVAALAYHFARAGTVDERAVEYARAAGENAIVQLAFDEAVAFFQRGLEAADDADADDRVRCSLMIQLGTAQRLAGTPAYRETLLDAAHRAQQLGDADLLADAALANNRGIWSATGSLDSDRLAVLEDALDAVGPDDSVTRARLLALLALELTYGDPERRRFALSDQALAMARRVGDESALLQVWTARHLSGSVPDHVEELVADLPDVLELAERVGDPHSLVLAASQGFLHCIQLADLDQADALLDRVTEVAGDLNNPLFHWLVAVYRCTRAMVGAVGGDELDALATAGLDTGQEAGQHDAFIWYSSQLFGARAAQGRLEEILDLVRRQVEVQPGLPIWRGALAAALIRTGHGDDARTLVDSLLADAADPFPYDRVWIVAESFLAEAVSAVGTPEQAARQYEVIKALAGRLPCISTYVRHSFLLDLATLAVRADWPEVAEQHFAEADAEHVRLNAPLSLARTRLEWGRFLVDQDSRARAIELLSSATELAEALGAADIAAAATEMLVAVGGS